MKQLNQKTMRLGFGCLALCAGLLLGSGIVQAQVSKSSENIVATITLKKGSGIGAKCGFTQQLQTIQIYSDGSALSSRRARGTSCSLPGSGRGLVLQGGFGFPPQPFRIQAEHLESLLAYLRQQQKEAYLRTEKHPIPSSWDELHTSLETQSLALSVSDDRLGSRFSAELPQVFDTSVDCLSVGMQIISEIERVARISTPATQP